MIRDGGRVTLALLVGLFVWICFPKTLVAGTYRTPLGAIEVPYQGSYFDTEFGYGLSHERPFQYMDVFVGAGWDDTPHLYGAGVYAGAQIHPSEPVQRIGVYAQYTSLGNGFWGRGIVAFDGTGRPWWGASLGASLLGLRVQAGEDRAVTYALIARLPLGLGLRAYRQKHVSKIAGLAP